MGWTTVALALFGLVLLVAVKLCHKQLEKAGAWVVAPLVAVTVVWTAFIAYRWLAPEPPAQESEPPGGQQGPASRRRRPRHTYELVGLVRKLPLLDKQEGGALSNAQASALASALNGLGTDDTLTQDQAKSKVEAVRKILTLLQLAALDKIELPRPSRGPRGPRSPDAGAARPGPESAAQAKPTPEREASERTAAQTTSEPRRPPAAKAAPETRQQGPRGRPRQSRPDRNPFQRDRFRPALAELLQLLDRLQADSPAQATPKQE